MFFLRVKSYICPWWPAYILLLYYAIFLGPLLLTYIKHPVGKQVMFMTFNINHWVEMEGKKGEAMEGKVGWENPLPLDDSLTLFRNMIFIVIINIISFIWTFWMGKRESRGESWLQRRKEGWDSMRPNFSPNYVYLSDLLYRHYK